MKRRAAREPPPDERPEPISEPITRRELVLIGALVAIGIAVRVWAFSRSAVEHFDEGVYASNLYFDAPDYAYPLQRYYAPPLLPALIEAGMIARLPPNVAALVPSFLAGCATIAALWWFGRSWFGPAVGICAAALAALSDFHVTFSATALTDVLLGLWLVLAVDAIGRSLLNGDLRWAVGAGLYTGLAWWTKYNGWLPLAIEAAALPLLWMMLRPPRKQLSGWLSCFAVTALVAAAAWSPYYFSLQAIGGYEPIAANHAKYIVGFAGWFESATRQMSNQIAIGMGLSFLGLCLAIFLPSLLQPRRSREALWLGWKSFGAALVISIVTGLYAVSFGAILGIWRMIVAFQNAQRLDADWKRKATGLVLTVAWWVGMLVATPFYSPYPRLTMPLVLAALMGGALFWSDYLRRDIEGPVQAESRWGCLIWIPILGCWICFGLIFPHEDAEGLSHDRRGVHRIAGEIRATDIRREARAIYVYGEPALYFQLRAAGEEVVAPSETIPAAATAEGKPIPTFLAVGPHAQRDAAFRDQWAVIKDRWELVQSFAYRPSALVWLDLYDPRQALPAAAGENHVRLYRLRLADQGP